MTERTLPSSPADRIALLLARSELGEDELARVLDLPVDVPGSAVLSGEYSLSPSDLVALADVLDVPVTVLSGQVPFDRHLGVSLRLGTVNVPDVPDEALYYADRLLRYRGILDSWLGASPTLRSCVNVSTHGFYKKAGQESAERLRKGLQLGEEPITDLVGITEELGFPVVFRPLPNGTHGLNVQDAREGTVTRLIIVSTRGPWTLQRYTLAHELCHALYDDDGQVIVDYVDVPDRLPELRAEAFARHLLLPAQALRHDVGVGLRVGASWAALTAHLMVRWGMSRTAVLRALEDDGLAGSGETSPVRARSIDSLMAEAGLSEHWEELSAGESESSGSPQLVSRALEAYGRGLVGEHVVAELLGQDIGVTRQELLSQGWGEPEPAGS